MRSDHLDALDPVPRLDGWEPVGTESLSWRGSVTNRCLVGTHLGPLDGIEATGKRINIAGQLIWRFEGTKIAEEWEVFDEVAMLRQIGAFPE